MSAGAGERGGAEQAAGGKGPGLSAGTGDGAKAPGAASSGLSGGTGASGSAGEMSGGTGAAGLSGGTGGAGAGPGSSGPSAGAGGANAGLAAGTVGPGAARPGATLAADPPPPGAPAPIACLDPPPPGMACIPAGWFIRGSDTGPEHARPQARVWLQTYYLDLNEVTYAEYKACVKAKGCDPKGGPAYSDFDRPKQPVNGVNWFHAEGYCKAQGKRLPSEAQWEKGARGPDGALHPWGDEPATCERAILKDETGRGCGVKKQGSKPDTGRPWEVGSRAPGRYGLYDMSGNSWEWVADWFTRSYAECGADCEGIDPLGPCAKDGEVARECPGKLRKIVRGGSWYWDASYATGVWRRPHFPSNQPFHHFGFRCAANPREAEALQRGTPAK
ncbi:SUMF1/EgtB/PvdO family nonheme iron enzyme [Nannocystis sp. ILAH1]|uniref:formylglycine-generating enzyme family protein n=1 Tax=Nannocystis sp. ILAH1 TaxID=2996789 RepID=UPI0022704EB4|nr:SUMF1/EgtB/PvdO family nonheme iron enzyme [Nannocystis sp. ILAH1]MCY0990617.1 SUMF1/EgtB/PvdO family nonheme iron enzyme [Nannocystis sp. ILAH1]